MPLLTIAIGLSIVSALSTGCSNLPLRTLDDTELPLPPSQAALAKKIDERTKEEASSKKPTAPREYSINDFLPPANEFKPEPEAKIVGAFEIADMPAVKLKATASRPPAPTIALAGHQEGEDASHQHDENCDCLKKKTPPKLAKVEPLDPATFIASTQNATNSKDDKLGNSSLLRPLSPQATTASKTQPEAIRLTARPKAATVMTAVPQQATTVPETANRAQMLIPIDPEVLKKFKADSMRRAQVEAETFAKQMKEQANQKASDIVINPKMSLPDPPVNSAPASSTIQSAVADSPSQPKQAWPESIRVSTKPFDSFQATPTNKHSMSIEPSPPKTGDAQSATGDRDGTSSREGTSSQQLPQDTPCKCEAGKCTCKSAATTFADAAPAKQPPTIKMATIKSDQPALATIKTSNQFSPSPSAKAAPLNLPENSFQPAIENESTEQKSKTKAENQFEFQAHSATLVKQTAQPNDLPGLTELPDMATIEKSLAEFDKANTFDPASIDRSNSVDPKLLKAKLQASQPKPRQAIPGRFAQKTGPSEAEVMLAKQLASQQSALKEIQSAISELKPKSQPAPPAKPVATPKAVAKPKFQIGNAAFCTRIEGFGQFSPFASNTFSSNQRTLLYCEIENQTSNRFADGSGTKQFETLLRGSVAIYDAKGNVVQSKTFPQVKDVARQRRRDFYVYFPVTLENLAAGEYRLELNIEDELGQQKATLATAIRFSVK